VIATLLGSRSTGIELTMASLQMSTTATVFEEPLVMYANWLSGVIATADGVSPIPMVAAQVGVVAEGLYFARRADRRPYCVIEHVVSVVHEVAGEHSDKVTATDDRDVPALITIAVRFADRPQGFSSRAGLDELCGNQHVA
jgi:hypothetical protein